MKKFLVCFVCLCLSEEAYGQSTHQLSYSVGTKPYIINSCGINQEIITASASGTQSISEWSQTTQPPIAFITWGSNGFPPRPTGVSVIDTLWHLVPNPSNSIPGGINTTFNLPPASYSYYSGSTWTNVSSGESTQVGNNAQWLVGTGTLGDWIYYPPSNHWVDTRNWSTNGWVPGTSGPTDSYGGSGYNDIATLLTTTSASVSITNTSNQPQNLYLGQLQITGSNYAISSGTINIGLSYQSPSYYGVINVANSATITSTIMSSGTAALQKTGTGTLSLQGIEGTSTNPIYALDAEVGTLKLSGTGYFTNTLVLGELDLGQFTGSLGSLTIGAGGIFKFGAMPALNGDAFSMKATMPTFSEMTVMPGGTLVYDGAVGSLPSNIHVMPGADVEYAGNTVSSVPEPTTLVLLIAGAFSILLLRKLKTR